MHEFKADQKRGVYDAIFKRRDIRREFLNTPIPDDVLLKLLEAAHHAGSVGFMQPWNFVVIRDVETRRRIKEMFEEENARAAERFTGERRNLYKSLKLEGILDAPVNICVTCDPERGGPNVLGRATIRETDLFSTSCAVQNFWLAARAEGIGVGWVSILSNTKLKELLGIPARILPVAYLCVGYVSKFPEKPMLETEGWEKRLPLNELIFYDSWGNRSC